jgi:hypothetical protein
VRQDEGGRGKKKEGRRRKGEREGGKMQKRG